MNPEEFQQAVAAQGIILTEQQMAQFALYYRLLVKTNEQVNLTAITAENEVYLKHFYDSLTAAIAVPEIRTQALSLADVGAGAGFPSIPLKIAFPQLRVTIIDSLNKRINFLQTLVDELGLTDVTLVHARAEEFGGKKSASRETFDLVTARAVARMSILSEFCLPLVRVGGQFVALKAQKAPDELHDAQYAIAKLGGKIEADKQMTLPQTGDERHIVMVSKVQPTPRQYPRKAGTPARKPLVAPEKN